MGKRIGTGRILLCAVLFAVLGCMPVYAAAGNKGSAAGESYRVVKVYQMDGTVTITGKEGTAKTPYVGMNLSSGDTVKTGNESHLYLKVDNDKYLMAEPNTVFTLEVSGTAKDSRTKITLTAGTIVNRLDEKLNKNSSYEVTTSNATMAVRGTLVRTSFMPHGPNQPGSTAVDLFEGTVRLTYDGKKDDDTAGEMSISMAAGEKVQVKPAAAGLFTAGSEKLEYRELSLETLTFIQDSTVDTGRKLTIPEKQLEELVVQKKAEAAEKIRKEELKNLQTDDPEPASDPEAEKDREQKAEPESRGTAENLPD